jgi:hypothetical protein
LDLYQKIWQDIPLGPDDYIISIDEHTSIQARKRKAEIFRPRLVVLCALNKNMKEKGRWPVLLLGTLTARRFSADVNEKPESNRLIGW